MTLHNNNDEQKIIDLYQKTRLQQPSTQLDHKIMAAAKNKLANHKRKPRKIIWALSSVAVIVLSVNVALKLVVEPTTAPASYAPVLKHEDLIFEQDKASEVHRLETENTILKKQKFQTLQRTEKKAMLKSKAMESKRRTPRIMHSPAPQTSANEESLFFSDSVMAIAPLPIFPFNVRALRDLYPDLMMKQKYKHTIKIYSSYTLILSLHYINKHLTNVTAYPQGNELNLNINWALKADCNLNKTNNRCPISPQQTGWYENKRLIKVMWQQ